MWTMNIVIKVVLIMLAVAFTTLLERKILGLSQNRVGPNKISFKGILQPVFDGVKLFMKECFLPEKSLYFIFIIGPTLSFLIMMLLWGILKESKNFFSMKMAAMFFLVCLGLSVYSSLLAGWASMSKFALVGSIRSCSQSVSYEISMALFFISVLVFFSSMSIKNENFFAYTLVSLPVFAMWFFSCLAETNRAPFDFSEGESELISGFNIEFGAITFTLLFLAEYGMIIFFSFLSSALFFSFSLEASFFLLFLFLIIRSVYPRFRYDKLMQAAWTIMLPAAIFFCFFVVLL